MDPDKPATEFDHLDPATRTEIQKHRPITIYARLTAQGTAAAETAVCDRHLDRSPQVDEANGPLVDCSDNEALACQVCGDTVLPNYGLGEEVTECPKCGRRTLLEEERADGSQVHQCPGPDCGFRFRGFWDDDWDTDWDNHVPGEE